MKKIIFKIKLLNNYYLLFIINYLIKKMDYKLTIPISKTKEEFLNNIKNVLKDLTILKENEIRIIFIKIRNKNEEEINKMIDKYKLYINSEKYYYNIRIDLEKSLLNFINNENIIYDISNDDIINLVDEILYNNFENYKNNLLQILTFN